MYVYMYIKIYDIYRIYIYMYFCHCKYVCEYVYIQIFTHAYHK